MIQEQKISGMIVAALSDITKQPKSVIKDCFKYNVMTSQQVAFVTGLTIYSVETKIRESKLTSAYPFSTDKVGPKFVVRDEKFDQFISTQLQKNG